MQDFIGYDKIIEGSMRNVVREVLKKISKNGLQGSHYFVISFLTDSPGVSVPQSLKKKFPEEITIVIQYQFENLVINKDLFEISLSFSGKFERLVVPYKSITSFADPSINFGLKFSGYPIAGLEDSEVGATVTAAETKSKKGKTTKASKKFDSTAKVVSLDAFREKKDK